ncbi:Uncharacterised protein [Legionella steigerwaltii]|uniref:Uncharacterized protein n=1 Tax=Legionella steigerwaltii TaxID=460 RepID=A0A378L7M5_9GAMM|nr:hypothetical protein [Legionella steigerwaltii]KTD77513.1 hypothetical protein Lstg_1870 [Legionella steigerwaltii]STY22823.1 Uncharacterised protein [Legionella steigerwaltii]
MTINKKNNTNQNKFFKNIPEGLLQDTLPTMRNIIVLLDKQDEQEEESRADSSHRMTPSL